MNRIEILNSIWSRSRGRNVFLPQLRKGVWLESDAYSLTSATRAVPTLAAGSGDLYFTPLRYDGIRRRGFIGSPGVIFADLDGGVHYDNDMKPSVLIETSDGHFHGYWFLDEPADAGEWESHAKGWTTWIGADPAGWDSTQVLRMPNSLNHKYDPVFKVTTVRHQPAASYDLEDFPEATMVLPPDIDSYPEGSDEQSEAVLHRSIALGTVPLGAVYWLTVKKDGLTPLGTIDRSAIMWQIEKSLLERGFTPTEVFHLLRPIAINKWAGQDHKLWAEIQKAASK